MALPTVADLKQHINIPADVTTDDDELGDVLDAAIELAESIVGPLTSGTVTEIHRGVSSDVLVLQQMPVGELVAVSSRVGATTTALTLGDYELDTETGMVRVAAGTRFAGTYVVEYTAGADTPSASQKLGILIIASHLWQTQRVPGVNRFGTPDEPTASPGFAIPNRAVELLAPSQTVTFA